MGCSALADASGLFFLFDSKSAGIILVYWISCGVCVWDYFDQGVDECEFSKRLFSFN